MKKIFFINKKAIHHYLWKMSQNIVARPPNKLFLSADDYNQLITRLKQYPELKQLIDEHLEDYPSSSNSPWNQLFSFIDLEDLYHDINSMIKEAMYSYPGKLFTQTSLKDINWNQFKSTLPVDHLTRYGYDTDIDLIKRFIYFAIGIAPWLQELKFILDAGWNWYYFSFVNPDHVLMRAKSGRLPLSPETFEQAAQMNINDYPRAVKVLCQTADLSLGMGTHNRSTRIFHIRYDSDGNRLPPSRKKPTFSGWSKNQLTHAIRKVGTVRFDVKSLPGQGIRLSLNPTGIDVAPSKGQVCGRYSETIFQGNQLNARFPGFAYWHYMPRAYYEALYRAIFHTPRSFKINLIIERRLMDLFLLRFIAIYDFNIPSTIVDTASPEEIGAIITARRAAVFPVESRQEITDIYEPLMKGPGTRFSRAVGQHFRQLGQLEPEQDDFNQYQMEYYRQILNVCTQPSINVSQTRQKILYYIRSLDLEDYVLKQLRLTDLNMVPQDKLCQILQGYVKALISQTQYSIQL